MARGNAVWGIDIGQSALKALRCTLDSDGKTVHADAFDFIEYPQILSQPDADPEALVRDALKEFLSRNSVRGDKVAISVSGQSGLARFIKLPPVEKKKVPDIVRYEAKQQIPFDLEDVIWSYQPMPGCDQPDSLEMEVGLFAMKREHVFRAIKPLDEADVELDIIQLTPIAIYNAVTHGVMSDLPDIADYDPEEPPSWIVVLSMGTESTDLVLTNGFRVWQRSIPLGGNHFTKQLTKEMKLTFAKAEQLKRNAREAENAKEVFQAMRSVFNDLVTEVQRSLGYFRSIERTADVTRIVALGNTIKLPGLQQYLSKNLQLPVDRVSSFEHLEGAEVVSAPAFEENVPSFAVSYGLALQGLGLGRLATNLVPRELVVARIIRRKKPWVLAACAVVLAGMAFNYMFHWGRWRNADEKAYQSQFSALQQVASTSSTHESQDKADQQTLNLLKALGTEVVGNAEGRTMMLELMKVVNAALPRDLAKADPYVVSELPLGDRREIHIEHIEMAYKTDLSEWFNEAAQKRYSEGIISEAPASDASAEDAADGGDADALAADAADGVTPPADVAADESVDDTAADADLASESDVLSGRAGWIVELKAKHYFNKDARHRGQQYVRETLLRRLRPDVTVQLPVMAVGDDETKMADFTIEQMGIFFPLIAADEGPVLESIKNPNWVPPMFEDDEEEAAADGAGGRRPRRRPPPRDETPKEDPDNPREFKVYVYNFTLQFAWIPRRASERDQKIGAAGEAPVVGES